MSVQGSWVMAPSAQAHALTSAWRQQWPHSPPLADHLKFSERSRWVRFHMLPASKRYPDTPQEYDEVLRRHHTLLGDLAGTARPPSDLLLITCGDSATPTPVRPQTPASHIPADWHWLSVDADRASAGPSEPGEDELDPSGTADATGEEERWWRHLYTSATTADAPQVTELLRLVADGHAWGVLITPPDLRWLYHPYDGGADVIAATPAERDALTARHASWLPSRPDGL